MRHITCGLILALVWSSAAPADERPAFDEQRAFEYLVQIYNLGPRFSGSTGMTRQQKVIVDHFSALGADCGFQSFDAPHPLNGTPVRLNNLIVSWHPESKERILLCCHYDTRPFPDEDPRNPRGEFRGANDGASGVALLMELGNQIKGKSYPYGIDMVFFDAEEFVFKQSGTNYLGKYFLGSEYFAKDYRDNPPDFRYVWGILVDMIGDRSLQIYYEGNSLKYAPELTRSIWATAKQLNERAFVARERHFVNDDHIPLNEIAKIPTCDLIDFDYRHWHTLQDTPSNCSGKSLGTVGRVLLKWLESPLKPPAAVP